MTSTGPGLFICGTDDFYNVDAHLVYLSDHCMLSGCNVSINQFNPIEVPSDSLLLKQCDSVS